MKKILYLICAVMGIVTCLQCTSWTDTEPKFKEPVNINTEEYYKSLREYKASKHSKVFGWYGNWTAEGASLVNSLKSLPDSVDFISLWSGATGLSELKKKELEYIQKVKGTKVLFCLLMLDIGDQLTPDEHRKTDADRKAFWGWVDGDNEAIYGAIRKYANAVLDTINKYGYDGFDIDWEPSYAQPFPTNRELAPHDRISVFIETLAEHLGPKSGTGRLFVIDGEPANIPKEQGAYFDHFILQTYKASSNNTLDSKLSTLIRHYDGYISEEEVTNKLIVTETVEDVNYAIAGGYNFTDAEGNSIKSIEGMAKWKPYNGFRKGGTGTYHMEAEFRAKPEYRWLRQAIQIMNPANK